MGTPRASKTSLANVASVTVIGLSPAAAALSVERRPALPANGLQLTGSPLVHTILSPAIRTTMIAIFFLLYSSPCF